MGCSVGGINSRFSKFCGLRLQNGEGMSRESWEGSRPRRRMLDVRARTRLKWRRVSRFWSTGRGVLV